MNILQLILLISFFSTTNARWYIKKTDQTKPAGYPNPGKRSLPEEESDSVQIDCSKSFSQLNSYQDQSAWIFTCLYNRLQSQINEDSLSSNSDDITLESSSTSEYTLQEDRIPSYDTEYNRSFNKFLRRLRQGGMEKK
jgi:hypothetical protein